VQGQPAAYRLGDWIIRPALNQASCGDRHLQLPPKAMDVLVCLLEHANEVVSPELIMDQAWPGRVVEESSVYNRISQIRRVLGDDPVNATWIQRIPRRGYRLVVPVSRLQGPSASAASERETPIDTRSNDRVK